MFRIKYIELVNEPIIKYQESINYASSLYLRLSGYSEFVDVIKFTRYPIPKEEEQIYNVVIYIK